MGFYKILASSYRLTNIFSSKNFKKVLLFVLIGVILFLVFSNNVFASTPLEFSYLSGASQNGSTIISDSTGVRIYYFKADKFTRYIITNNGTVAKNFYYSVDEPSIGDTIYLVTQIGAGESYEFVGSGYFTLTNLYPDQASNFSLEAEFFDGYGQTVDGLVDSVSMSSLWSNVGFAIPLIGVAVLFAIGFYIVCRNTKSTSKAKVKF